MAEFFFIYSYIDLHLAFVYGIVTTGMEGTFQRVSKKMTQTIEVIWFGSLLVIVESFGLLGI